MYEKRVEWVGKGNDKGIVKDNSFKLFICSCIEMRVYILLVLNIESQHIVFKSASLLLKKTSNYYSEINFKFGVFLESCS